MTDTLPLCCNETIIFVGKAKWHSKSKVYTNLYADGVIFHWQPLIRLCNQYLIQNDKLRLKSCLLLSVKEMKTSQSDFDPHREAKSRPLSVDRHVTSLQKKICIFLDCAIKYGSFKTWFFIRRKFQFVIKLFQRKTVDVNTKTTHPTVAHVMSRLTLTETVVIFTFFEILFLRWQLCWCRGCHCAGWCGSLSCFTQD